MEEILLASQRKDIDWTKKYAHGPQSPNFQGGKYIDDKGYVRILNPEHPKNIRGYAYEHRMVMEKYLGRYLQAWETVHHINEIKEDNRLDNLFLCSHSEHSALHKEGAKSSIKHKEQMRKLVQNTKPHTKKRNHSQRINIKKSF